MESELVDFLQYCRVERRLAELTCSAYERDVRACARFLRGEGVAAWQEVCPAHLRRFLADEAIRRPAPSSQARTVAALKGFFGFCVENEYLERNPALVLRTPKKREAPLLRPEISYVGSESRNDHSRPIPSSAVSPADDCNRRSSRRSSNAPSSVPGSRRRSRPTRCATPRRAGFGRRPATRASSPSTSVTLTSPP